jgi:hypothetical protein
VKLHAGRDGPERLVMGDRPECDARGFANRSLSGHRLQRVELPGGGEVRQALGEALEAGIDAGELPSDLDVNAVVNMLTGSFYAVHVNRGQVPKDWVQQGPLARLAADVGRKQSDPARADREFTLKKAGGAVDPNG